MVLQATIDMLVGMKMTAMAAELSSQLQDPSFLELGFEDRLGLLVIQKGSGRKSKCAGIEEAIVEELETNNYHTRQQIADMIEEKFQVKLSCSAVGDR